MIHEIKLSDISPYCVLRDLVRNAWVILMIAAIAVMGATISAQYVHKNQYTASVTYYVSMRDSTSSVYANLQNANRVATTLTDVYGGSIMKKVVGDLTGCDMADVSVYAYVPMETTNLLRVFVTTQDPYKSYLIARAYMDKQNLVSDYIFDNATLDVLEAPEVPSYPSNYLDLASTRLQAGLVGFVLSILLIVAFTVLRDTVMTESAARDKLAAPHFGTLTHEAKNKTLKSTLKKTHKSILIGNVGVSFQYTETVKRLCSKIEFSKKTAGCKAVMVTSATEDEGKSTVSINLALGLAERGHRVLLLDGDIIRPSLYYMLERQTTDATDYVRCVRGKATPAEVVAYDERTKLHLALNRRGYADSSDHLASPGMAKLMAAFRASMDFIIIDTPPASIASDTEILANYADAAVVVVAQDTAHARTINETIDKFQSIELLGTIFNNVHGHIGTTASYYGKGKYGKYYASARREE
jgi:capsular exopolysaccharide synthesis family protein